MAFLKKPLKWTALGQEPSELKKSEGFKMDESPAPGHFDFMFRSTYEAIEEIQQKAGEVKTVNNVQPDVNGNVLITLPDTSKLYQKPTSGIPKVDLESSVQSSLEKADNAAPATELAKMNQALTTHKADLVSHGIYGVATGTNALVMTDSKVTSYVDGMLVAFKNTTASTASTTLNINSLGAKAIVKANGTAVNNLKANAIYQLRYNGVNFTLLGEGGEYGNVTANDVRSTKTFGTDDGIVQGTLDLSNLTPENIQWGTTVGGVTGELTGKKLIRPLKPDSELSYEDNSNAELKTTYYTDAKKVTVNHSGMIRITYNLFLSGNGNTAYAGIFKNGIQMKEISNTVNYVEVKSVVDISVVTGDVITLRLKVVNTSGGSFNNLFQIGVTTVQIGPNVVTKGVV